MVPRVSTHVLALRAMGIQKPEAPDLVDRDRDAPDSAVAVSVMNDEDGGVRTRRQVHLRDVPDVLDAVFVAARDARGLHAARLLNRADRGGLVVVLALDPRGEVRRTPVERRLRGEVERGLVKQ